VVATVELVGAVRTQLEPLRLAIQALIKASNFEGGDAADNFLGVRASNYLQLLKATVIKSQFEAYKNSVKTWVKSVDQLLNKLGINETAGKYNYRTQDLANNLGRLFKTNHALLALQEFFAPIQKGIVAAGFSIELTTLDDLFTEQINSGKLYQSLIGNYNKAVQAGTFEQDFDTLETVLPTVEQIKGSILKTKIDLVLNRAVKYLELGWDVVWENENIIEEMLRSLVQQLDIPAMIRALGNAFESAPMQPLSAYLEWFPINIDDFMGIQDISINFPMINIGQLVIDAIQATVGEQLQTLLDNVAAIAERTINNLLEALRENLNNGQTNGMPISNIRLHLPITLSLGETAEGKLFAYGRVSPEASAGSVFSLEDSTRYNKRQHSNSPPRRANLPHPPL
jgi:hypothetical protein